jgi:hypothetical protein
MLIGTLLGFTFVFIITGIWKNDFDWGFWLFMMLGGTIGHLGVAFLTRKKNRN